MPTLGEIGTIGGQWQIDPTTGYPIDPSTGIQSSEGPGGLTGHNQEQDWWGTNLPQLPAPNPSMPNTGGPMLTYLPGDQYPGAPAGGMTPVPSGMGGPLQPPPQWAQWTQDLGRGDTGEGGDKSHQQINTLLQRMQSAGYDVKPGPVDEQGRQDSIVVNGQLVRVFDSSGNWNFTPDTPDKPAWGEGSGGAIGKNQFGQYVQAGGGGYGGGNFAGGGFGSLAQGYGTPFSYQPFTEQFQAPTAEQARNTPGYQFALQQGLQGIERGASARGDLLTGGTLKGLQQFGTGLADQTYQENYDRARNEYLTRYGINQDEFNRNLQGYNTNYNVFRNNQNDLFGRFYNLAQLGAQSAGGATQ